MYDAFEMKISRRNLLIASMVSAITTGLSSKVAFAAQSDELKIGIGQPVSSIDPHYHAQASNTALALQLYGSLVQADGNLQPSPALADRWTVVDDLTWEFALRKGVKFHDGSDFDAEDVLATFKRIPNVENALNSFAQYIRVIEEVEVINPHLIRFKTSAPAPMLLTDLAQVAIINRKFVDAKTDDFNNGTAAIGCGPYKLAEFVPGEFVRLERNDNFYGPKQHWASARLQMIRAPSARTAALLAGDVDLIDQVQIADLSVLQKDDGIVVERMVGAFPLYLHMDQNRDASPFITDNAGNPLASNPLKDVRVRKAISMAINRVAIVERVLQGLAGPAGALMPPEIYAPTADMQPDPYDPDAAKALLAEAGYPEGFKITLHAPNERYPQGPDVAQAIAGFLTRVGISTAVEIMPWTTYVPQASNPNYNFSLMLFGWPSGMPSPLEFMRGALMTPNAELGYGAGNRGRYSNPEFDKLVVEAFQTVDPAKRDEITVKASKLVIEDRGVVMLYYIYNLWAHKVGLAMQPRADGYTLAMMVAPQ